MIVKRHAKPRIVAESALFETVLSFAYLPGTILDLIAPWCNGSTRDFGSLCLGSSPSGVIAGRRRSRSRDPVVRRSGGVLGRGTSRLARWWWIPWESVGCFPREARTYERQADRFLAEKCSATPLPLASRHPSTGPGRSSSSRPHRCDGQHRRPAAEAPSRDRR